MYRLIASFYYRRIIPKIQGLQSFSSSVIIYASLLKRTVQNIGESLIDFEVMEEEFAKNASLYTIRTKSKIESVVIIFSVDYVLRRVQIGNYCDDSFEGGTVKVCVSRTMNVKSNKLRECSFNSNKSC